MANEESRKGNSNDNLSICIYFRYLEVELHKNKYIIIIHHRCVLHNEILFMTGLVEHV